MTALINLESSQRRNLLFLFFTALLFWINITSLLPTLPTYIEDIGATRQQLGLVMGCVAIGLLPSRPNLGWLADYRSRKLVILIGSFTASVVAFSYIFAHSIPLLMILRVFHGVSLAAFTTGYSTLIIDLSPPKQRGELIGYMSLAVPIGMGIGPALGGFLEAGFGYTALFMVSGSASLFSLILASQVQEAKRSAVKSESSFANSQPVRSFNQLLQTSSLIIPALILLLIGLLFGTLSTFLPLFIRDIKLDLNTGLFYSAAAIASFAVRVFVGKASDTLGRGLFITMSLTCYGISMVMLALATTPQLFILAAIIEGTGAGLLIPMMLALMSDRCYANERGKVSAFCIGGFDLGIAMAGPILGSLGTFLSYRDLFSLAASFAVFALVLFLTQSNKNLVYSFRFALGKAQDAYALESKT